MRIGIDAHAAEKSGEGNCTYIRNFLLALADLDDTNEYVLYATDAGHPFYARFAGRLNFRVHELAAKNPIVRIPFDLARASRRDRIDILHVQYIAPFRHGGKLVATIHDLGFLHRPQFFSKFFVLRSKWLVRMSARRAARIITGSQYSKSDIVQSYGLDDACVEVVPYGVSAAFKPDQDPGAVAAALERYGITEPYLLCVGRLNPRKNLATLAQAFGLLKDRENLRHSLVIAGKADADLPAVRRETVASREQGVIFTGFIPDEDLPLLYAAADVFIYPSLFEGVGLPVLEAMASGVPVVTSNTTSLRETAGDAALTVDPLDVDRMAEAISRLARDPDLRRSLCHRGLERASEFTWERTAERTLEVYRSVHG